MTNKEKREFFNWLQKQGVLEYYKRNRFNFLCAFKNSGWIHYPNYSRLPKINAIDLAFDWTYTPEGYDFWAKLDTEWSIPLL